MRASRIWLTVAGLLLTAGVFLVMTSGLGGSPDWFAVAPESRSSSMGSLRLLTTSQIIGWAAVWLASLIMTGVVVRHRVRRRSAHDR